MQSLHNNQKGFTLIEMLFAVLIFSTSLVTLMTIAGKGISATLGAYDQASAQYLAQEGMEAVRNMRDTRFLNQQPGLEFLAACDTSNSMPACYLVYNDSLTPPVLASCPSGGCPTIKTANGGFVDNGTDSQYTRTIIADPLAVDSLGNITMYRVSVVVNWTSRSINRSIVLKTILTEWK